MSTLTISQAASLLDISTKTLKRWEDAGVVTPERNDHNHRLYSLSKLTQIKYQQSAPTPDGLSITQAAQKYHISPKTLRRWEDQGLISVARNNRNQRLYDTATLRQIDKLIHAKTSTTLTTIKRLKQAYPTLAFLSVAVALIPALALVSRHPETQLLLARRTPTEGSSADISLAQPLALNPQPIYPEQSRGTAQPLPSTSHLIEAQPANLKARPTVLPTPAHDVRLASNIPLKMSNF